VLALLAWLASSHQRACFPDFSPLRFLPQLNSKSAIITSGLRKFAMTLDKATAAALAAAVVAAGGVAFYLGFMAPRKRKKVHLLSLPFKCHMS